MSLETSELNLLKEEYDRIHNIFWECHKIYWQMTSIFLPITLGAGTLVIKDLNADEPIILIFTSVILITLLTFWILATKYLRSWNYTRLIRLKYIEGLLQLHYSNSYKLYGLNYKYNHRKEFNNPIYSILRKKKRNKSAEISFSKLNECLYMLLLILIILIFIEKFGIITRIIINLRQCIGINC